MVRKPKIVGFTPQKGRRVKKNAGGVLTSILNHDRRPRGTGGSPIVEYTLTSDWGYQGDSTKATCTVTNGDLSAVSPPSGVINDSARQLLMTDQVAGDVGWCFFFKGEYWAIQAPCTSTSGSSGGGSGGGSGSGGTGAPTVNPTTYSPGLTI